MKETVKKTFKYKLGIKWHLQIDCFAFRADDRYFDAIPRSYLQSAEYIS